jgi:hypothetical protein
MLLNKLSFALGALQAELSSTGVQGSHLESELHPTANNKIARKQKKEIP